MSAYTLEQIRALERSADAAGYHYDTMLEAAGQALARAVRRWPRTPPSARILVLVGPGNNGGDGLVAARALAATGNRVAAYLWKREPDRWSERAEEAGVIVRWAEDDASHEQLRVVLLPAAHVVLDALFGTGLARPITGEAATILNVLRAARAREPGPLDWLQSEPPALPDRPALVAVDIPSGIHGDSGAVDAATVAADLTVTFIGPKIGMLTPSAAPLLGELVVADIGIPASIVATAERDAELLTPRTVAGWLPERRADSHKGSHGRVLVVGGSSQYVGAPALAAVAAGRSGAGWVTVAVPSALQPMLAAHESLLSATWLPLSHAGGALRPESLPMLLDAMPRAGALVLGPGLGGDEMTRRFVWRLLGIEASERRGRLGFAPRDEGERWVDVATLPTVVDADALNALAAWEGRWWEGVRAPLVLTPHPGEMARLTESDTATIQGDRLGQARLAARRWGHVVVLKGAHTVVAAPDGRVAISPYANDALARAGSGDVLSGIIGALLAAGMAPYEAAGAAVVAHALAGEVLRGAGAQGALASDLLDHLPALWARLRRNPKGGDA